jgi:hypothetical protein
MFSFSLKSIWKHNIWVEEEMYMQLIIIQPTISKTGYTILYFHQQCVSIPVILYTCEHLLICFHYNGYAIVYHAVLICVFLMANMFNIFESAYIFSFMCLFKSFTCFWRVVFLILSFSIPHGLWIEVSWLIYVLWILWFY